MRLIRLLAVFGIGYVLGSRAGRQRFEEIRDLANRFGEGPRVQEAAETVSGRSTSSWPEHPDAH
ncbi:hypothetical protein, partial [Salmonella enterica]|uniref:hypothetical protein n=1 Tax=Salmonella enterica TaxID=28901 RepID=UPI00210055C9